MRKIECFKIRLHEAVTDNIFEINNTKELYCISCERNPFCLNPTVINADPFLFSYQNKLYLFYESKILTEPAMLKMTSTTDMINWSKPVVVLKEDFHLSFPYVFEEGGIVYMIPETGQDHSIRLYQAIDDSLTHFSLVKKLITRKQIDVKDAQIQDNNLPLVDYCDSSIFKMKGIYYLFTSVCKKNKYALHLFYSKDLKGDYVEHPLSPIANSNKIGRCGGSIFKIENDIYSIVAQLSRQKSKIFIMN